MVVAHTGENIANSIVHLLQAVLENDWMDKVLGISTNGAASMTGIFSGAVTHLEHIMKPNIYRMRCGAHQLDLAVQNTFEISLRGCFHSVLHALISYLRIHTNFKAPIGSVCLKEENTHRISMDLVYKWIIGRLNDIQSYLE